MALYSSPQQQPFTTGETQDVNTARSNVNTPGGSMTWLPPTTPGGQWTQTTTLDPAQQAALTAQQKTTQGLSTGAAAKTPWAVGAEAGPMDYSKFMAGGSRVNGGQYYDQNAGNAVYKQFSDRMEPQFQRDTAALETQLRNQGLKPGDEAWNDQIRQNNQAIADQRQSAQNHATEVAASEGSRMQGMDVSAGNYNTDQRTQQIAQELQKRGYGVKEIQDMLSNQGVGIPNFPSQGIGNGYSDAMARTYGEAANAAKDKNASTGSWLNLAGKAGSAIMDNYGKGGVVDKVASYLGFNPAASSALSTAATQAGIQGLTDMGASTAANMGAASQIGSDIAGAANYGVDTAAVSSAAPEAASAAAPTAGASWLPAAGGVAAGLAGMAAIPVLGHFISTHMGRSLSQGQWGNILNGLKTGTSGNATYDKGTPPAQQIYNGKMNLFSQIRSGMPIPPNVMAVAKSYGMYNADNSINQKWVPPTDPMTLRPRGSFGGGGGKAL